MSFVICTSMAHNHSHHSHHHHDASSNIKVAFFLNLGFTIIEIIGGLYTNSLAIMSDALHDLGDSLSLGLAWYFEKLSHKKRDHKFSYGYKRFSLLGAIINSIILIVGSIFIINAAIPRIISPEETNAQGMIILAIFGIIVNGAAVLRLKKGETLNEKVVSMHLLEDVLGWVAVLIAGVVMLFADVPILDPILSVMIGLYILFNVFKNLKESLKIILQGTPETIDLQKIENKIASLNNVLEIHDTHLWSMDGQYNVLTIHVVIEGNESLIKLAQIKTRIKQVLKGEHINHATIEFETKDEHCELEECCE